MALRGKISDIVTRKSGMGIIFRSVFISIVAYQLEMVPCKGNISQEYLFGRGDSLYTRDYYPFTQICTLDQRKEV
jgi:hypothetical protein